MSLHDRTLSRERAHSRATGALFFVGFGAVWVSTGLAQAHRGSAAAFSSVAAVSVLLLAAVGQLMRRSHDLPATALSVEEQVRQQRMFTAVNIIQWVSIATAVAILGLLHMPEYVVPAISILVGLHLFPLAGSFRNRGHYVTGALLLLWPLGCLLLLPRNRVSSICAMGVGVTLLLSAAATLAWAFASLRTAPPRNAVAQS